jgi:hypothetical protein
VARNAIKTAKTNGIRPFRNRTILWAACALLAIYAGSASADYIDDIAKLYESGRVQEAYQLAQDNLFNGEGDPMFDFYYGMAAIDSGAPSEGTFALERLLLMQPENHRARLELARGYYLLEQYPRARLEFQKVLETNPPEQVRTNINQYLAQMDSREQTNETQWGLYAEAGIGYDTNINGGTSSAEFSTPTLGTGVLDDSALAEEDWFYNLSAGVNVTSPMSKNLSFFGSLSGTRQDNFDSRDSDTASVTGLGGLSYASGNNEYRASIQGQDYRVGHTPYRDLWAGTLEWRHFLSNTTRFNAYFQGSLMEYDDNPNRDSKQGMLGIGILNAMENDGSKLFFGSVYGGMERSQEDNATAEILVDKDIFGVRGGFIFTLAPDVNLTLSGQAQRSNYREEDVIFSVERMDDYYNASGSLTWQFHKNWSVRGEVSYSDNRSNIEIYSYDRTVASLFLRADY